jgi:hypothetical protein
MNLFRIQAALGCRARIDCCLALEHDRGSGIAKCVAGNFDDERIARIDGAA